MLLISALAYKQAEQASASGENCLADGADQGSAMPPTTAATTVPVVKATVVPDDAVAASLVQAAVISPEVQKSVLEAVQLEESISNETATEALKLPPASVLAEMENQEAQQAQAVNASWQAVDYKCDVEFCAYCCCWGTHHSLLRNLSSFKNSIVHWWRPKFVGQYFTALLTAPVCQIATRGVALLRGRLGKVVEFSGFCSRRCRDCNIENRYFGNSNDWKYAYNQCAGSASYTESRCAGGCDGWGAFPRALK